jgi:hypothetical protein
MVKIFLTLLVLLGRGYAGGAPLVCTVCSVGIVSGLGVVRILGISENVIALWYGATLFVASCWILYYLKSKNMNKRAVNFVAFISSYLLVIPLYVGKNQSVIFNQKKTLFVDSFIFFVLLGSVVVFASEKCYKYIKNKNGKPHFPFEKVVLPIASLLVVSLIISFWK